MVRGASPPGAPGAAGESGRSEGRDPLRHGPLGRALLTAFLLVNFGSIAVYILPKDAPSVPFVPAEIEEAVGGTVAPAARWATPVARRWLDLTATRQHWTLFAPFPARWTTSLEVVAWFPEGDGAPVGPGGAVTWASDTLLVEGPVQVDYPHWTRHRPFRIVFNMGYEGWGDYFRPWYAAWTCARLREQGGRMPDGVELTAVWEAIGVPWRDEAEEKPYRQYLGGFTCAPAVGESLPPYLVEVPRDEGPGAP